MLRAPIVGWVVVAAQRLLNLVAYLVAQFSDLERLALLPK